MSKSLDALNTIFNDLENASIDLARADLEEYKIIEKELKALEIIKREMIDIVALISSENLFMYNTLKRNVDTLTREEFDLLKEALLWSSKYLLQYW